jgi:hypothetical protein
MRSASFRSRLSSAAHHFPRPLIPPTYFHQQSQSSTVLPCLSPKHTGRLSSPVASPSTHSHHVRNIRIPPWNSHSDVWCYSHSKLENKPVVNTTTKTTTSTDSTTTGDTTTVTTTTTTVTTVATTTKTKTKTSTDNLRSGGDGVREETRGYQEDMARPAGVKDLASILAIDGVDADE